MSRLQDYFNKHTGVNRFSQLTALLPSLYSLFPSPAAMSAVSEVLSESEFKFGKGTKVLTEPLVAWIISEQGQRLIESAEGGKYTLTCLAIRHLLMV